MTYSASHETLTLRSVTTAASTRECNSCICYDRYVDLTIGEGEIETPMQWRVGVLADGFVAPEELCTKHLKHRTAYLRFTRRLRLARTPMTRGELASWITARGMHTERELAELIEENLGKTEDEMDRLYDSIHCW